MVTYDPTTGTYKSDTGATYASHDQAAKSITPNMQTATDIQNASGVIPVQKTTPVTTISSSAGAGIVSNMKNKTDAMTPSPVTPVTPTPKQDTSKEDSVLSALADESLAPADKEALRLKDAAAKRTEDTKAFITSLGAQLDSSRAAALSSLGEQFNRLVAQQEDVNKRTEAVVSTAGIRSGGGVGGANRFTPEITLGFLQATVSEGLSKVGGLISQRNEAISKVNSAYDSSKFELMGKEFERLNTINDNLDEQLSKLNEEARKISEKQTEATRLSNVEDGISALISNGFSDPNEILQVLKKAGYSTNSKEIAEVAKNLTIENKAENLPTDIQSFNYLKENGLLLDSITSLPDDEQYFAFLTAVKGAEKIPVAGNSVTPVKPSIGATNSTEETMIRTRLFSKLMNIINKGQVSDTDRKIIDERIAQFRDAGMGEQEIMDKLSGFATDVTTPYNTKFRNSIVQNTSDANTQTDAMGKVSLLLNSGDAVGAMKMVENLGLEKAKGLVGTGENGSYLDSISANVSLARVNRIKEILQEGGALGAPGGPVAGTFQNLLGRFKGENATKLKAELTQLYASFRKDLLGSAVTPSETKFLEPLIADITDKKANFLEKINTFEQSVLDRYNSTRRAVNLPTVSTLDVIDDNRRLKVYEDKTAENEIKAKVIEFGNQNPVLQPQLIQMEKNGETMNDIMNWINQQTL